jgi:hypothetical protein
MPVIAQPSPTQRYRAPRKAARSLAQAFQIEDLLRIEEWRLRARPIRLQAWIALDGVRTDEVLCVNLPASDRIARWTVTPLRGGRARFAEASPRRRSWSLDTVADALEAVEAASAFSVESA